MNLKTHGFLVRNPLKRRSRPEFFDLDNEPIDESIAYITKVRQVQSVRAIISEAEYLNSKVRFKTLQNELIHLRTQTMIELDHIWSNKVQVRQNLIIQYQKKSEHHCWHELERQLNKEANNHSGRLADFCQVVQQSQDALAVATHNNLYANRRLLKLDEFLNFMNSSRRPG